VRVGTYRWDPLAAKEAQVGTLPWRQGLQDWESLDLQVCRLARLAGARQDLYASAWV
jgi:hypothetical protein